MMIYLISKIHFVDGFVAKFGAFISPTIAVHLITYLFLDFFSNNKKFEFMVLIIPMALLILGVRTKHSFDH